MKNQKEKVIEILSDIKLPNRNEDLISSKSVDNIKYNKVALIDIDTMVHWDTPDIFEITKNLKK